MPPRTWARINYLIREIRRLDLAAPSERAKSAKRLQALRNELMGPTAVRLRKERAEKREATKVRAAAKRKANRKVKS